MGSSSKSSAPANLQGTVGTPPPGAPMVNTAGFQPGPTYQGFAGQPFNENAEVYPSFLPRLAGASATGLDQGMLNAIMGISPAGAGRVTRGAGSAAPPQAAPQMAIPQLRAPEPGSMRGRFQQAAQGVADATNKAGTLDAYLAGRDQLARLQALGGFRRGAGSGIFIGGRGSGPGYGSSGPGGVGMGAGRTV